MTKKSTALKVIRADMLEVGRSYTVLIHGKGKNGVPLVPKQMVLRQKPADKVSKLAPGESFVFSIGYGSGRKEVSFAPHGNKGPQFLVTRIPGKNKDDIAARVTFYTPDTAAVQEGVKKAA